MRCYIYYLCINVEKTKCGTYKLHQKNKTHDVLNAFELNEAKPTYIPMELGYLNNDSNEKLSENNWVFCQTT